MVETDPKALFSWAAIPKCKGERYSFPWIAPIFPWKLLLLLDPYWKLLLLLDPYLIILSVQQGGIMNFGIEVGFLSRKKSLQNLGSTKRLKSKPLLQSGQQVEQYA